MNYGGGDESAEHARRDRAGFAVGHPHLGPATDPLGGSLFGGPLELPVTPVPTLVLLYHPDLRRIGETSYLTALQAGRSVEVSRLDPLFSTAYGYLTDAIGDPRVSRTPVVLTMDADGAVQFDLPSDRVRLSIDGVPCGEAGRRVDARQLARGVVLNLQDAVLLWLGWLAPPLPGRDDHGMFGNSPAMARLRDEIDAVAGHHTPVLIRGETGVGKELVARAIHAASSRAARPFLAVNMAALAPSAAASELFGHRRGAFTDAVRAHDGFFGAAHTGTLFMDEIGETPSAVQPLLLRALNDGQIQPVGGSPTIVDVRLIAATDADLEREVALGRFREALLHRIAAWTIDVPPLRQRRDMIPVLFMHFLGRQLEELGATHRLLPPAMGGRPWLSMRQMAELMEHAWPGNIRQLRNFAIETAIRCHARAVAELPASLHRPFVHHRKVPSGGHDPVERRTGSGGHERRDPPPAQDPRAGGAAGRPVSGSAEALRGSGGEERGRNTGAFEVPRTPPAQLSDEQIVAALEAADFNITATARELRIAKNTLIARMASIASLPRAAELERATIEDVLALHQGRVIDAARQLRVGEHALRLRLAELSATGRSDGDSGD